MDIFILEPITQALASSVIQEVHSAKDPITAHIMTLGGDILAGNAISATFKNSPQPVTTNVVGVAASMGAVISQAGNKRTIAEGAVFNVHNGAMGIQGRGTKEEHREAADTLDKLDAAMMKSFQKTGLAPDELADIMKLDKLLTAEEAVTLGFFDEVSQPIEALAILNSNTNNMSKFSELLAKVDTAAVQLGLKETDNDAKKALVAELQAETKAEVEQIIETPAEEPTGADILTSEMVSREEYELFKAEVLALIQPLLGAVEEIPSPEETSTIVEETTTAKLDSLLSAIKSKTVAPNAKQSFEQPVAKQPEDWSVYKERQKEIKDKTGR